MSSASTSKDEPSYLTPREHKFRKGVINKHIPKRFSFSVNDQSEDTIAVNVRVKPYKGEHQPQYLRYHGDDGIITIKKNKIEHSFKFTHIITPEINQEELFKKYARSKLQKLINGENSLIFTYGATSSGKTFTAHGDRRNPGLIPRALVTIFKSLNLLVDVASPLIPSYHNYAAELPVLDLSELHSYKKGIMAHVQNMISQSTKRDSYIPFNVINELNASTEELNVQKTSRYSIWITFYEIYNEKVYDLLDDDRENRQGLKLMTDKNRLPYVKDLCYIQVNSLHEAYLIYMYGRHNLSVFGTGVNDHSSRSHSIFTINIIERPYKADGYEYFHCSSFSVCDLAGTERSSRAKNIGMRLKESQVINTSLLVLNKCLRIIRDNQKSEVKKLVPYRESKLTQILGPALTVGGTELSMLVTISQDDDLIDETEVTLKNSSVATTIKMIEPPHNPVKKSRFSMAISQCAPGQRVKWNVLASQQAGETVLIKKEINTELLEEKMRREEAEENLIKCRSEIAELKILLQQQKYNKANDEQRLELEEECTNLRIQYLKAQKYKRITSEELEAEKKRTKELEATLKKYEDLLDAAQEEVVDLQEAMASSEEMIQIKDQLIEDLKKENAQAEERILALTQDRDLLNNQLQKAEAEIATLKAKMRDQQNINSLEEMKSCLIPTLKGDKENIFPTIEISPEPESKRSVKKKKKKEESKNTHYMFRNLEVPVINIDGTSDSEYDGLSPEIKPKGNRTQKDNFCYTSEEDPDFLVPPRPRTRGSVKKRQREKKLPEHFHGISYESDSASGTSNVRTKKQLFNRRSSVELGNISDMLDINQTQASPGRIIQRALRTRQKK